MRFKIVGKQDHCPEYSGKHVPVDFSLTIEGENVKLKKTFKTIGVTFDSQLTWQAHIKKIAAACGGAIYLLKLLCGMRWERRIRSNCSKFTSY